MTANKLAEALKIISNYSKATIITDSRDRKDWAEDVAFIGKVAVEALALHEAEIALAALTAEQRRLGMYGDEKQEPDRLDAERQVSGFMSRATHATSSGAGYKQISFRFAELGDAEQMLLWAKSYGAKAANHYIDAAKEAKP